MLQLQPPEVGLLQVGNPDELAVVGVGPAVVGADEGGSIPHIGPADTIAAVPTDVQKSVDLAGTVAYDQDRICAHVGAQEVPRVGDLALVAQEKPAAGENFF